MVDRPEQTREPKVRDATLISAAIVAASLIISWGSSDSTPRYQLASAGDAVVRLDNDSGEMLACDATRCARVRQPDRSASLGIFGIRIEDSKKDALPPPDEKAAKAP